MRRWCSAPRASFANSTPRWQRPRRRARCCASAERRTMRTPPMSRLEMPPEAAMTPEQSAVCAEVVAGRRGKVPAPMIAWLRNPELARRGQVLGELLRYQTTLEPHLTELAILVCGRHWTSHHEWTAHKAMALKAGLDPEVIAAIAARSVPQHRDERQ